MILAWRKFTGFQLSTTPEIIFSLPSLSLSSSSLSVLLSTSWKPEVILLILIMKFLWPCRLTNKGDRLKDEINWRNSLKRSSKMSLEVTKRAWVTKTQVNHSKLFTTKRFLFNTTVRCARTFYDVSIILTYYIFEI